MIVYMATNTINKKKYIGASTASLNRRKTTHKSCAKNKKIKSNFWKAINKYGFENFIWEILCEAKSKKELFEKEKVYIKKYKSNIPEFGYNSTDGGPSKFKYNQKTVDKLKKSATKRSNTEKHKDRFSKIMNSEKVKTKRASSQKNIDNKGKNNPNYKNINTIELKEMYKNSVTMKDIAKHFGVGHMLISRRIKELGLKRKKPSGRS